MFQLDPNFERCIFRCIFASVGRKKNTPSIRKKRWGGTLWSPSYFADSCGGAPIEVIRLYIEQQQPRH
jgi:putative transposase